MRLTLKQEQRAGNPFDQNLTRTAKMSDSAKRPCRFYRSLHETLMLKSRIFRYDGCRHVEGRALNTAHNLVTISQATGRIRRLGTLRTTTISSCLWPAGAGSANTTTSSSPTTAQHATANVKHMASVACGFAASDHISLVTQANLKQGRACRRTSTHDSVQTDMIEF